MSDSNDSITEKQWQKIKAADASLRMTNPIRAIVDKLKHVEQPDKPLISMSIGNCFSISFSYQFIQFLLIR